MATAAVFARVAIPEMLAVGYSKRLAAAVVAAGGTLASLIPPSAILVIYAILVEQSVGKLLIAGFVPGVYSAFVYVAIIVAMATWRGDAPAIKGFTWGQRFASIPGTLPIFAVVAIIFVSLFGVEIGGYSFAATPTEAGSLGAFVVLVTAFVKGMRLKQLGQALHETAKLAVMIFTLIWGVLCYVRFLGFAGLPDAFRDFVVSLPHSPMLTLVLILCAYAVLGMFIDAIGMLILTLPVVYPAVMALNGRRVRLGRRQRVRHVGRGLRDLVRHPGGEDGGAVPDHPADRAQLLRGCGCQARHSGAGGFSRLHPVLHRRHPDHRRAAGVPWHRDVAAVDDVRGRGRREKVRLTGRSRSPPVVSRHHGMDCRPRPRIGPAMTKGECAGRTRLPRLGITSPIGRGRRACAG